MIGRSIGCVVAISVLVSSCTTATAEPISRDVVLPPVAQTTVFDGFDGPAGSLPDAALWNYDLGRYQDAGLQTYTNSPDNIRLDGSGHLVIEARRAGDGYTSARPTTRGRTNMLYGKIAARIKFPAGQGIWPAFWLLGSDYPEVGWPRSGEIDIMEVVNTGTTYHVTLHGPQGDTDYYGGVEASGKVVGTKGPMPDLTADFHTYWLDWQPYHITIGVDDKTLGAFTPAALPVGAEWAFERPMFVLMNIAVGGPWPGPPDGTTPFPATMLVDWFSYQPML